MNQVLEQVEHLTKEQIGKSIGLDEKEIQKLKKRKLLKTLEGQLRENEWHVRKLFHTYNEELSLHPTKVEQLLTITKTERTRWTKEGKLIVTCYDSFHKWGKEISYPLYDSYQIFHLTEAEIETWRSEHVKSKQEKRKHAVQKAAKTRKKNEETQNHFYEHEWKGLLKTWHQKNPFLGSTLQLAFWTSWMNRWAKEFELKARRARIKTEEYKEKSSYYYEQKQHALSLLIQSPYTDISFYEPKHPDKLTHLHFCGTHFELWKMEREFGYVDKWMFYHAYEKDIHTCKHCHIHITEDYYSLYYIRIHDPSLEEFSFSFHFPHPIGKNFLPNKNDLPCVQHTEQEGLFRFGRTLFDEEKIVFTERNVQQKWNEAVTKFSLYLS